MPPRTTSYEDEEKVTPVHVVWELTLGCTLKCTHCGSRAGSRRDHELSTSECIHLVDQLAEAGTREINLIGGEAFLRKDWLQIIRHITSRGIFCTMQTGAYGLSPRALEDAAEAGLRGLGVSIDGMEELHDRLRGRPGSFKFAMRALETCQRIGIASSVNTQIGHATPDDLLPLMGQIIDRQAKSWQLQLTVAMGNAVDNSEQLLQPYQLLALFPLLARIYKEAARRNLAVVPGNNIGYFGPYESLWRGPEAGGHYVGCAAGLNALGIEADGTVKACPSLNRERYSGGNIRDRSFDEIWADEGDMAFNRRAATDHLSGFCRECYYAEVCRGGCTWTSDSLLGESGNNPFCHHRAIVLAQRGLRERVVKVKEASQAPFSTGLFQLVLEPMPEEFWRTVEPHYRSLA